MQDEAAPGLDGTAEMDADVLGDRTDLDVELAQQVREGDRIDQLVDDQPHRAVRAVRTEIDHRPDEARIGHLRHRDEHLALEIA